MSEKRILIVDDDDEIRELLEFDVAQSGYFVDTAKDGLEGLNKALNNTYDLILLDVLKSLLIVKKDFIISDFMGLAST